MTLLIVCDVQVLVTRSDELGTGYMGGKKRDKLPHGAAAYSLLDHPYVQTRLHLDNGNVVALLCQVPALPVASMSPSALLWAVLPFCALVVATAASAWGPV